MKWTLIKTIIIDGTEIMTKEVELYRAVYADEGGGYISKSYPDVDEEYGDVVQEIRYEDATLDEVIQALEGEAESANYHDLINTYSHVAGVVTRVAGKLTATKVMREIYKDGGFF